MGHARSTLLLLLLVLWHTSAALKWPTDLPIPPPPRDIDTASWQEQLLQALWDEHKGSMGFCLGTDLADAKHLLRQSFPDPLPTGPPDDPLCSNSSLVMAHLCTPMEIQFWFKYLLLTSDPEKLPSNTWCDVSSSNPSCAPGFFQTRLPADAVPGLQDKQPHACCPGYFCPSMLTCVMPCPLGAWCPRAWPSDPPVGYLSAATDSPDAGLVPSQFKPTDLPQQQATDKWCAPYAYKLRPELGCGGAAQWTIEPSEPFPRRWDWSSGNIYCTGGRFCPNTTSMLDCEAGHFCKSGSSSMSPCPPLLGCPAKTESPTDNWLGFAVDAMFLLLLVLTWQATQLYNRLMRRLNHKERMKLMWNSKSLAPEVTVVEDDEDEHGPLAPPPTARQTAAGGHPGSTAAAATASAAAVAVAEQAAGNSTWLGLQLPTRFGFLSRAKLLRRRSSRAGSSRDGVMQWASVDDAADGGFSVPLLQYDAQEQQGEELSAAFHRRTHSGAGAPADSSPDSLQQQVLPLVKVKAGRSSAEQAHDLISTRVYPAISPASIRDRLDSEASSGARFFRAQHSTWGRSMSGSSSSFDSPGAGLHLGEHGRVQLDVGFENLGLKLKSCGKVVLQGVTGRLEHGRLAAVMGPSGAGKSSLLAALSGRASYAVLTGTITINGRPDRLERHKRLMGFVPQSDIMYRTLTVEENLMYSACFRLPGCTTPRQRLQVVAAAIDVLGLDDVRHQIIGNEEVRGISGGQVKRVNCGLELVAQPALLFLDEPTSGLDSTASKQVVQCLQRVARTGVTVAAVIHQPSWETFCLFDDLILLAKGGVTAYHGQQDQVQAYFEGLGFELPPHANPAESLLDIIAGAIKPKSGEALDIAACWRSRQEQDPRQEPHADTQAATGLEGCPAEDDTVVAIAASRRASQQSEQQAVVRRWRQPWAAFNRVQQVLLLGVTLLASSVHESICNARDAAAEQLHAWAAAIAARRHSSSSSRRGGWGMQHGRRPPGMLRQYCLVLGRAALMRTREPLLVCIEYAIFAVTGMFVGLMSERGRGSMSAYVGNTVYSIVAMGMLSTISGVKVFGGPDRLVFYREASTGLSKLAYFWALDTWSYVGMVLRCAVYLGMYYTYSQPRAVVWQLYVVTCAIYYSCQGQAFLLSQVMGPNAAQLTAAVSALINALVASKFSTEGALGVMNTISYARWGLEGYVIAEANKLQGVWLLARCADLAAFAYDVTKFGYAIRVLICVGFGSRVAACVAMLLLHRHPV